MSRKSLARSKTTKSEGDADKWAFVEDFIRLQSGSSRGKTRRGSLGACGDVPETEQDIFLLIVKSMMSDSAQSSDDLSLDLDKELYNIDNDYLEKLNIIRRKLNMMELTDDEEKGQAASTCVITEIESPPGKEKTLTPKRSAKLACKEVASSTEKRVAIVRNLQTETDKSLESELIKDRNKITSLVRSGTSKSNEHTNHKSIDAINHKKCSEWLEKDVTTSDSFRSFSRNNSERVRKPESSTQYSKKLQENLDKIAKKIKEQKNTSKPSDVQSKDIQMEYDPPKKKMCLRESPPKISKATDMSDSRLKEKDPKKFSNTPCNTTKSLMEDFPPKNKKKTSSILSKPTRLSLVKEKPIKIKNTPTHSKDEKESSCESKAVALRKKDSDEYKDKFLLTKYISKKQEREDRSQTTYKRISDQVKEKRKDTIIKQTPSNKVNIQNNSERSSDNVTDASMKSKDLDNKYRAMLNKDQHSQHFACIKIPDGINKTTHTQVTTSEFHTNKRYSLLEDKHVSPKIILKSHVCHSPKKATNVSCDNQARDKKIAHKEKQSQVKVENLFFNLATSDNSSKSVDEDQKFSISRCSNVPNTVQDLPKINTKDVMHNVTMLEKSPVFERCQTQKKNKILPESSKSRPLSPEIVNLNNQNSKECSELQLSVGLDVPKKVSNTGNFPAISNVTKYVGYLSENVGIKDAIENDIKFKDTSAASSTTRKKQEVIQREPPSYYEKLVKQTVRSEPKLLMKTTIHAQDNRMDYACNIKSGESRYSRNTRVIPTVNIISPASSMRTTDRSEDTHSETTDMQTDFPCFNCFCFKFCKR